MSVAFYPLNSAVSAGTGTDRSGTNWSYEQGLYTWTPDSLSWQVAWVGSSAGALVPYDGQAFATFDAFVANVNSGVMTNDDVFTSAVGQVWTATCRVKAIPNSGQVWGRIGLKFLDASNAVIGTYPGSKIANPDADLQHIKTISTVTATAPALTAKVKIYVEGYNTVPQNGRVCFDWCTLHG